MRILTWMLAVVLWSSPLLGQQETRLWELEEVLQVVYENHPGIAEARAGAEALRQAAGYADTLPNPQLKATLFLVPVETRVGPQWMSLSLSQGIPFWGKLSDRRAVAEKRAGVETVMADARARDVLVEAKLAYYELQYVEAALAIVRENREIAEHIIRAGAAGLVDGEVPLYDANRAQAELARLDYDEAVLLDQQRTQIQVLAALMNSEHVVRPVAAPSPSLLAWSTDELQEAALENRLEIQAAEQRIGVATRAVKLARRGYFPDFMVGVNWMVHEARDNVPDAGKDAFGVTVGLEIPVWTGDTGARVDEARAMQRQAQFGKRRAEVDTRLLVARRLNAVKDTQRLVQLYRKVLVPQAQAALESEGLEGAGGGVVGALLERKAVWLQYRLASARAQADHAKAVALLEQVVGKPLLLAKSVSGDEVGTKLTIQGPDSKEDGTSQQVNRLKQLARQWQEAPPQEMEPGNLDMSSRSYKRMLKRLARKGLKDALAGSLNPTLVIAAVLGNSPDVDEALRTWESTINRYSQVAHLDNIVSQYADILAGLAGKSRSRGARPRMKGAYPSPGGMELKSRIATNEIAQAAARVGLVRRKAVTRARLAYADYGYAWEASRTLAELVRLTRQTSEVVQRRVGAGTASQRDVLQAEMELAQLESMVADHADLARRAAARIATLAGLSADAKVGLPSTAAPIGRTGRSGRRLEGIEQSHEVKLGVLAVEKLDLVVELLTRQTYPDLSSGADVPTGQLAREGQGAFPAGPMVKTDVFLSGKEAYLAELAHRGEALKKSLAAVRAEVSFAVEDARRSLRQAKRARSLHGKELADKARRSLDLALAGYGQGRTTFADLLEAQRRLVHHRLEAIKASRDAARAWALLQDVAMLDR